MYKCERGKVKCIVWWKFSFGKFSTSLHGAEIKFWNKIERFSLQRLRVYDIAKCSCLQTAWKIRKNEIVAKRRFFSFYFCSRKAAGLNNLDVEWTHNSKSHSMYIFTFASAICFYFLFRLLRISVFYLIVIALYVRYLNKKKLNIYLLGQ